ncbi:MAG: FtsX-like permease family protein [Pirellulales bacterium]|nr:FtsX-like permease family protein [Pirellulales bacterium]
MSILKVLLAEISYRRANFALSVLAVTIAVTLFVAGPMLVEAYQRETRVQVTKSESLVKDLRQSVAGLEQEIRKVEATTAAELDQLGEETRRLMVDMGFNLMIVHRDTNMSDFWAADFAVHDMPQEYVDRLAADTRLTYVTHLVATLQSKIDWQNRKILLTGYLPETTQSHMRHKSPMGYTVEPGTVLLGHELAVGRKAGETVEVLGKPFRIARVLPEQGSKEDITIAMHLTDAQSLLDKPGKINQIMALGCNCAGSNLPNIRKQLSEVLPEAQITEFRSKALARAEQRELVAAKQNQIIGAMKANLAERQKVLAQQEEIMANLAASRARIQRIMETLAQVITPLVVLAAAVWVGLLAMANVRERRTEIGLLRAIGKSSGAIASLFLGKAFLLGLLGAVFGAALGTSVGQWFGLRALDLSEGYVVMQHELLIAALLGAPLVTMLASYLPTLSAVMQDPAVVLRET